MARVRKKFVPGDLIRYLGSFLFFLKENRKLKSHSSFLFSRFLSIRS
ncbi:hypothetical protein LEP1GSC067_4827 [Leptospira interrogans serovar Lora str. TE 1992]|uniref:Uncharacterized protein n=1 Tax=Leptospira interrogans serovar Lora str. TE 1992 TaxID=1193028 RepID=M3CT91_LEPIR|nr:hypothetical protein LEP1GSC067_4827 [Leptospira interrogans serovar Lora str. TE 1992]